MRCRFRGGMKVRVGEGVSAGMRVRASAGMGVRVRARVSAGVRVRVSAGTMVTNSVLTSERLRAVSTPASPCFFLPNLESFDAVSR